MSFQVGELFYTIGINPGEFEKLERELRRKEREITTKTGMSIRVTTDTKQAHDQINTLANRIGALANEFKIGRVIPADMKAALDVAVKDIQELERRLSQSGHLTDSGWKRITAAINQAQQAYRNYEQTAAKSGGAVVLADKRVQASLERSKKIIAEVELARSKGNMTGTRYIATLDRLQNALANLAMAENMSVKSARQLAMAQLDLQKAKDASIRSNKLQEAFLTGIDRKVTEYRSNLSVLKAEYNNNNEAVGRYLARLQALHTAIENDRKATTLNAGEKKKLADISRHVSNEIQRESSALAQSSLRAGKNMEFATREAIHYRAGLSQLAQQITDVRTRLDDLSTRARRQLINPDQVVGGATRLAGEMDKLADAVKRSNLPLAEQNRLLKQLNVGLRSTTGLMNNATGSVNQFALAGQMSMGVMHGMSNVMLVGLGPAGYRVALAMSVGRAQLTRIRGAMAKATVTGGRLAIVLGTLGGVAATAAGLIAFLSGKIAVELESALADVRKTTGLTTKELNELRKDFNRLSTEIPVTTKELLGISAVAGQLGIRGKRNLVDFTEALAQLSVATDVTGEEGATNLARFLQATGTAASEMGSAAKEAGNVLNELENTTAATADQILQTTQYSAQLATRFRLSKPDILGIGAAILSVGQKAEASGTALSKMFTDIEQAAIDGGSKLEAFADITGVTTEEFRELALNNPIDAFELFIRGVGKAADGGANLTGILSELGIREERQLRVVSSLAGNYEILTQALNTARKEAKEESSLQREVSVRLDTVAAKAKILANRFAVLGQAIGFFLLPAMRWLLDVFDAILTPVSNFLSKLGESKVDAFTREVNGLAEAFEGVEDVSEFNEALDSVSASLKGKALEVWEDYREEVGLTVDEVEKIPGAVAEALNAIIAAKTIDERLAFEAARGTLANQVAGLLPGGLESELGISITTMLPRDAQALIAMEMKRLEEEIAKNRLEIGPAADGAGGINWKLNEQIGNLSTVYNTLGEVITREQELNDVLEESVSLTEELRKALSPEGEGNNTPEPTDPPPVPDSRTAADIMAELRAALEDINDLEAWGQLAKGEAAAARVEAVTGALEELIKLDASSSFITQLIAQLTTFEQRLKFMQSGALALQRPIVQERRASEHDRNLMGGTRGGTTDSEVQAAIALARSRNSQKAMRAQDAIRLERILENMGMGMDSSSAGMTPQEIRAFIDAVFDRRMMAQRQINTGRRSGDDLKISGAWQTTGGSSAEDVAEFVRAARERSQAEAMDAQRAIIRQRRLSPEHLSHVGGMTGGSDQSDVKEFVQAAKERNEAEARRIQSAIQTERILATDDSDLMGGMTPDEVRQAIQEARTPPDLLDILPKLHGGMDETTEAGRALKDALEELGTEFGITLDPLDAMEAKINEMEESGKFTEEQINKLREALALMREEVAQDSTFSKFADNLRAIGDSFDNLAGQIFSGVGGIIDGIEKIVKSGGKGEGLVDGIVMAVNGLGAALGRQNSEVNQWVSGIISGAGAVMQLIPGLGGVGKVIQALGPVISSILGDMGNGLKEINKQIEKTVKDSGGKLSESLVTRLAEMNTKQVSRGGFLGWLGFKKSEIDQEGYEWALDIANTIVDGMSNAFRSGNFAEFTESFDKMIEDMVIEALVMSAGLADAIADFIEWLKNAMKDGLDPSEIQTAKKWRETLEEEGKKVYQGAVDMGLITPDEDDGPAKGPSGGAQISEITGPTRDLLVDLLSPLASLDSLVGAFNSGFEVNLGLTNDYLGQILAVNTSILNSVGSTPLGAGGGSVTYVINVTAPSQRDGGLFGRFLAKQLANEIRHTQKVSR